MEETFITLIPKLTDAALRDYIENPQKYRVEAVELAIQELTGRGYTLSEEELRAIQYRSQQPNTRLTVPFGSMRPPHKILHPGHLRLAALFIAVAGSAGSIILYLAADPAPPPPLGYDPLTMKTTLREMQVYGGMANVLATQIRQWFASLWHGKLLAFPLGLLSLSAALLLWRISTAASQTGPDQPPGEDADLSK